MKYVTLTGNTYIKPPYLFFYRYMQDRVQNDNMHTHDFYEIFLTVSDNYIHNANDERFILSKGSLVFVRAEDVHENLFSDIPQTYVQLCFGKQVLNSMFDYLDSDFPTRAFLTDKFPPTVHLNNHDYTHLLKDFRKIELLNMDNSSEFNLYCKNLLITIFSKYFAAYSSPIVKKSPKWFADTMAAATKSYAFVDGMDEIVKISQKSYKQVSRCIKEYLGKTPSQYINDLRLNYAANLIRSTDLSVTDICFTCGFNNVGYFYTSFKNRYSQTPREMRIKANIRI